MRNFVSSLAILVALSAPALASTTIDDIIVDHKVDAVNYPYGYQFITSATGGSWANGPSGCVSTRDPGFIDSFMRLLQSEQSWNGTSGFFVKFSLGVTLPTGSPLNGGTSGPDCPAGSYATGLVKG